MAKENFSYATRNYDHRYRSLPNDADESLAYCTGTLQVAKQERSVKSSEDKANLFFSEIRIASRDADNYQ